MRYHHYTIRDKITKAFVDRMYRPTHFITACRLYLYYDYKYELEIMSYATDVHMTPFGVKRVFTVDPNNEEYNKQVLDHTIFNLVDDYIKTDIEVSKDV